MMRAFNSRLRYHLFERTKDKIRAKVELALVLSRQDQDGFFWDDTNHNSLQYHAYVLSLLAQYYPLDPQQRVKEAFLKGVNFLLPFIDQSGDFNYFGRGQRQVFGYTSFYHALLSAYHLTGNTYYQKAAEQIATFFFPILEHKQIVASPNQEQKVGWYPYNNRGDYLSFAGYYLLLGSIIDSQTQPATSSTIFENDRPYNHHYPSLNLFLLREKNFLICLGGTPGNHAELPFILHTYPSIFGTSGGPAHAAHSNPEEHYTNVPANNGTITFQMVNYYLEAIHVSQNHSVSYHCKFVDAIHIDITITPKTGITAPLFHCLTSDIKKIKTDLSLFHKKNVASLDGNLAIYETNPQSIDAPTRFSISFGHLKEHHALKKINTTSPTRTFHRILRYPYFGTILTGKALRDPTDAYLMLRYAKEREKYYQK